MPDLMLKRDIPDRHQQRRWQSLYQSLALMAQDSPITREDLAEFVSVGYDHPGRGWYTGDAYREPSDDEWLSWVVEGEDFAPDADPAHALDARTGRTACGIRLDPTQVVQLIGIEYSAPDSEYLRWRDACEKCAEEVEARAVQGWDTFARHSVFPPAPGEPLPDPGTSITVGSEFGWSAAGTGEAVEGTLLTISDSTGMRVTIDTTRSWKVRTPPPPLIEHTPGAGGVWTAEEIGYGVGPVDVPELFEQMRAHLGMPVATFARRTRAVIDEAPGYDHRGIQPWTVRHVMESLGFEPRYPLARR